MDKEFASFMKLSYKADFDSAQTRETDKLREL